VQTQKDYRAILKRGRFRGLASQRRAGLISRDKEAVQAGNSGGGKAMSPHMGRIEKRIRLTVPLEVSKLRDPSGVEQTITEDVSSSGVRVLTRRAMAPNERLMVRAFQRDLQTRARVVYCQRLPDGRYGVGLRFQKADINFLSAARRGSQNRG